MITVQLNQTNLFTPVYCSPSPVVTVFCFALLSAGVPARLTLLIRHLYSIRINNIRINNIFKFGNCRGCGAEGSRDYHHPKFRALEIPPL
jgi:hypothetical protein